MGASAGEIVLVTGATGLIGRTVCARLLARGCTLRTLSRSGTAPLVDDDPDAPGKLVAMRWDGLCPPPEALDDVGQVVHLSGEPLFGGFHTLERRQRIYASRIDSTRAFVDAFAHRSERDRPHAFICASAVGIYGSRGEERLDEASPPGLGFTARLCREWECAAEGARAHGLRVVRLRTGLVLSTQGGALRVLRRIFRLGLGGPIGRGRQWMPWIHIDDAADLIVRSVVEARWNGPVNLVAPNAVRNRDFTRALAKQLRRPAVLPVPPRLVYAVLGDVAEELVDSRLVIPAAARRGGFVYRFARLDAALADLLAGRSRSEHAGA